mgnify:CR=1 FL=1
MADTAQINPKIPLATKVRLLEFCKARGHAQGEGRRCRPEAYLTPPMGMPRRCSSRRSMGWSKA